VTDPPELACAVLAVGNPPALLAAVRSVIDQSEPVEVVVVSSGGTGAAATLAAAGLDVQVIEIAGRVLPGAARNRGIAATTAPYVSFLAADCTAEPGWAAARLRAHRAGAVAVASAVTNPFATNLSAWTSYVALFNRRMPGVPSPYALLYGVSYARRLFDEHGLFREDMRGGEDTDFHQRLTAAGVPIVWEPAVRTAHRHPTRLFELLRDQFRRGARSALAWERLRGPAPIRVATNAFERLPSSARLAWRAAARRERRWVAAAALLLPLAAAAYAAGSIAHALWQSGKDEE
jgi:glycosyltransferase involved in cell wall biosynthesis